MAAKLKACQEIQLPPNPRPIIGHDLDAHQRRQQILAAASSSKSPAGRHRYSHNGTLNYSHINAASLSRLSTNTNADKSLLSDTLTTTKTVT